MGTTELKRVWLMTALCCLAGVAGAQNPDALTWSTFLGGSDAEFNTAVKVDPNGFVWAFGSTLSADFPTTGGAYDTTFNGTDGSLGGAPFGGDGFLAKMDPATGQVLFCTYIGGSGDEEIDQIAFDSAGRIIVIGTTSSADFPVTAGAFDQTYNGGGADSFLARLNAAGTAIEFATYLGGTGNEQLWEESGLAIDTSDNIYFTGFTTSTDFPVTGGAFQTTYGGGSEDIYVAKFSADGTSLLYSTYLGGSARDRAFSCWLLGSNELIVSGLSLSADFPTTAGVVDTTHNGAADCIVAKLNTTGTALVFSTFLGGSLADRSWGVTVNSAGEVISAGFSASPDYPTTAGAFDQTHNGDTDLIITKLNSTATAILASTYIGGASRDASLGVVVDADDSIWTSGETRSADYPTTRGAYDRSFNGGENDCTITGINSSLTSLVYSTFIGGFTQDYSMHVEIDNGVVFGSGTAWSPNFPVTPGAFDTTYDGDGVTISDTAVVRIDTDTATLDTDGDGMPDWWEKLYGLNHLSSNGGVDDDADGLTNLQEFTNDTNPVKSDPDGDGLTDGQEINTYGTDPKQRDMDLDGLTDREEVIDLDLIAGGVQNPFDPTDPDTTGDAGSNAGDSVSDGSNDYDSDGISNKVEFRDGTSPIDSADFKLHPPKTLAFTNATKIVTGTPSMSPFRLEWSHDGTKIAYEDATSQTRFTVPADGSEAPTSRGTSGFFRGIAWGYGDQSLWHVHDVTGDKLVETLLNPVTTINTSSNIAQIRSPSVTERTGTNFIAYHKIDDNNVESLPINEQGALAGISQKVRLTNVPFAIDEGISDPHFSPDGDRIALVYSPPGLGGAVGHIATLTRVLGTLNGLAGAPIALTDERIKWVDTTADYKALPALTPDGETILYCRDISGTYNGSDFLTTDFEIAYAPADGTGSVTVVSAPGNQGLARVSSGGARLAYIDDSTQGAGTFDIFTAHIEASTPVPGNVAVANEGGAGNDGINDVVTVDDAVVTDVSNTVVDIPAGTVIDFPIGEPQEIAISTPTDPVPPAQLPAGVDHMTVVRDFGPDGTTFSPPLSVTIAYTEAELNGADEASLTVYLFNTGTSQYEAVPSGDIISHDLDLNTITFEVDHFSLYGLGGPGDADGDGLADTVDPDDDNDGVLDGSDAFPLDTDNDGIDNDADPDDDSDGVLDNTDPSELDTDNDGTPNATDTDDDADGIVDTSDPFLFDTDNDGLSNDVDNDDDGDGLSDTSEGLGDPDSDGIPNMLDTDSDNDGYTDAYESALGSDPYDSGSTPPSGVPVNTWMVVLALLAVAGLSFNNKKRKTKV